MRTPVLVLVLTIGLTACTRSSRQIEQARSSFDSDTVVLSIVATNDVHGHVGQLPYLAGYLDNLRASRLDPTTVLLVDSGDTLHGTLASNLDEGRTIVRAYNSMGYAALAIGNHDFDFGRVGDGLEGGNTGADPQGALKARLSEASFPILSANLVTADGTLPAWRGLSKSVLLERAGLKIGLIGALTEEAADVIKKPHFVGLDVAPMLPAVETEAKKLRQRGADVVILLAHSGIRCEGPSLEACDPDSELYRVATELPGGLVDLIAGGHRNGTVATEVAGVPIVHTASGLEAFSRVDLIIDRETRTVRTHRVFPPTRMCAIASANDCASAFYAGRPVVKDERIAEIVSPALLQERTALEEPLGVRLDSRLVALKRAECPLGNLFADIMRRAVPGAAAAITNGGSLRHDLPAGDLTFGLLYDAMPFDNQLARLRLTGAQLEQVIRVNVTQLDHGILSVAGVHAHVSCSSSGVVVDLFRNDGSQIEDDTEIIVATNDFLALGGDGLLTTAGVEPSRIEIENGSSVRDALVRGLREYPRGLSARNAEIYDPARPRIRLPDTLPVRCDGTTPAGPSPTRHDLGAPVP